MFNGKRSEISDINRPVQRGLFDRPENLMQDPGPALKHAMRQAEKEAQKKYSLSRCNIIDAMNEMADQAGITCNGNARKVTAAIYNKWMSGSDKHHIPTRWLPIFCWAIRSNHPLEVYVSFFLSVRLVDAADVKKLQWAEVEIAKRKLSRQSRQLSEEIGL